MIRLFCQPTHRRGAHRKFFSLYFNIKILAKVELWYSMCGKGLI